MKALRDVYNDSKNYNNSECITSFLVKTTNQLVIACRNYLNNNGTLVVLKQEPSEIIQKISVRIANRDDLGQILSIYFKKISGKLSPLFK